MGEKETMNDNDASEDADPVPDKQKEQVEKAVGETNDLLQDYIDDHLKLQEYKRSSRNWQWRWGK